MKTVTTTSIETATSEVKFGYWDETKQEFTPITAENIAEVAITLKCSPSLLNAIRETVDWLTTAVSYDQIDIWKRLDALEKEIKSVRAKM